MGSSAASAAAGAVAVNALFGSPLTKEELILPGLASEATVSGYHADNIAPALLGGFVLVRYMLLSSPAHVSFYELVVCATPAFAALYSPLYMISALQCLHGKLTV